MKLFFGAEIGLEPGAGGNGSFTLVLFSTSFVRRRHSASVRWNKFDAPSSDAIHLPVAVALAKERGVLDLVGDRDSISRKSDPESAVVKRAANKS